MTKTLALLLPLALTLAACSSARGCPDPEQVDVSYEVLESDMADAATALDKDRADLGCEEICSHIFFVDSYQEEFEISSCELTLDAESDQDPAAVLGTVACAGEAFVWCE